MPRRVSDSSFWSVRWRAASSERLVNYSRRPMEASSLWFTPPEAPRKMICFQNPICSNGTRTPMDDWGCSHGKMWDDFCASSFMDFLLPQEQANRYELLHTYCATSSLPTQEQSRRSPLRRLPICFITA